VKTAGECYVIAEQCERQAAAVKSQEARKILLEVSIKWRRLAAATITAAANCHDARRVRASTKPRFENAMEKIEDVRRAVEAIIHAFGDLHDRYDEAETLSLMRALGRNCPVTERALVGATPDQHASREALHRMCVNVEHAIRRAISQPAQAEHQQALVEQVRELHSLARSMRQ
jgi:hypothetical protein